MGPRMLSTTLPLVMLLSLLGAASCAVLQDNSKLLTPCFNPPGGCDDSVASEIENAESEVLIQAATLTSKAVADAIVKAKEAGLNVEILLDRSSAHTQGSASYFSQLKGIPTFIDARHAVVHSNAVIIDGDTVITGGFSLTNETGDRTAEDLVVIRSRRLAESYRENWKQHREHSEEFKELPAPSKSEPAKKRAPRKKKKHR